jgi:predicted nucleic acid-binding Zn ribbon protein
MCVRVGGVDMTTPTHTFVCPECHRSFEVDAGMRETLLEAGCAVCGAPIADADLTVTVD